MTSGRLVLSASAPSQVRPGGVVRIGVVLEPGESPRSVVNLCGLLSRALRRSEPGVPAADVMFSVRVGP